MKKAIAVLIAVLFSGGVWAEEIIIDKKEMNSTMKEDGWKPSLVFGASYSQNSRKDVIGQENGDDISLGAKIDAGLDYKKGQHEWRQDLKFNAATTKTSTEPKKFVKSADALSYESLYLYSLEKYSWIGPYVRLKAETSAFKGEDVRAGNHEYREGSATGTVLNSSTSTFKLTDGFKPLTTRESIGAFFKIIEEKMQTFEVRVGAGAVQVDADGQLTVASVDTDNAIVVISELESYSTAGAELAADYNYKFDKKTEFKFSAELFQPLTDPDDDDELEGSELLDELYVATITSKTYDWMAVSLEGKYQKQPQLQEAIQKQVSLLLTFTHTMF